MNFFKELAFLTTSILALSFTSACDGNSVQPDHMDDSTVVIVAPDTVIGCGYALYPPSDTIIANHGSWTRTNYKKRINQFRTDTIAPGSIVMLGNSLTEQGGNWSPKLGVEEVANRGIAGDTSDGALARLGEIMCAGPSKVFVMIGTNDLWTSYSPTRVGEKIDQIGTALADSLPDATIYIQTLMPLGEGHEKLQRLDDINAAINALEGRPYQIIDTYTAMANEQGILAADLTDDDVHLTAAGYAKWVAFLKLYISN